MTPEQNAELVAAIVKAVPEIANSEDHPDQITDEGRCVRCGWQMFRSDSQGLPCCRPITLEDVLRATGIAEDPRIYLTVWNDGEFQKEGQNKRMTFTGITWTLGKPLSEQSDETLSFLHSILCPTKG